MEKDKQVTVKEEKNFLQEVLNRTTNFISASKEIALPQNYDVNGAVKSFFLKVLETKDRSGKPALQVCSKESIFMAFFDLVSKGLDPRKQQAYPVVYGNQLKLQESYFGKQRLAYTYRPDLVEINAQVVRQGDIFEVEILSNGRKLIKKHETKFENADNPIVAAYAVGTFKDKSTVAEVMTMAQVQKSWAMSKSGGAVHKNFEEEMARKTVRSRLAKSIVNVTDDSSVLGEQGYPATDIQEENIIDINATPISIEQETQSSEETPINEMPETDDFDDLPLMNEAK